MSKNLRRYSLGLGVLVLAAMIAQPAFAACASPNLIESTYIYTPGQCTAGASYPCDGTNAGAPYYGATTPAFGGKFWSIGGGNPAAGAGNDNGTWPANEGVYPNNTGFTNNYPYYPQYIGYLAGLSSAATWAVDSRIDGCINNDPAPQCMALLLQDQAGGVGYYAFLTTQNSGGDYAFPFDGSVITLAPLPKPGISGSSRPTANSLELTVESPVLGAGMILDPNCASAPVSYKVFAQQVDETDPSNPNRDTENAGIWTEVGSESIGNPVIVTVNCVGDKDVFLAQTVVFDSGFELSLGSQDSLRAECGPNLAQPLRPQAIRPKDEQTVRPGRGDGRGR